MNSGCRRSEAVVRTLNGVAVSGRRSVEQLVPSGKRRTDGLVAVSFRLVVGCVLFMFVDTKRKVGRPAQKNNLKKKKKEKKLLLLRRSQESGRLF